MAINTSTIKFTGMASGLDTDSIIKDLMRVEQLPLTKLQQSKQLLMWKREQYKEINTLYSSLRNMTDGLRFDSSFNKKAATSNNTNVVTAQANNGAIDGSYSVKVNSLASSAIVVGEPLSTNASLTDVASTPGDFTITGPDGTKTITVTATSTRQSILDDINNSGTGIIASYDEANKRLMLSTKQIGEASSITISDASNVLKNSLGVGTTATTKGKDASVEINGTTMSMASNSFTFNGVNFSLRGVSTTAVSVDVAQDTSAVVSKITDFVNKYNEIIDTVTSKLNEKKSRDYKPLTDEQKEAMKESQITAWEKKAQSGLLNNDDMLKSTLITLRHSFMNAIEGLPQGKNTLSYIGITTASGVDAYKENGKLHIDVAKLEEVLQKDPEGVKALFTATSTSDPKLKSEMGFAERIKLDIDQAITKMGRKIGSSSLSDTVDSSTLGQELKYLNSSIYTMNERLSRVQSRYEKQFAAMEKAMQSLNNQNSWLSSQLSSL